MNGMNRRSLVSGLLVGMLLVIAGVFSHVAQAQSVSSNELASFDQKYLLSDYIAYSGVESIAQRALTIREAATFDANFLTPGSLVHSLEAEAAYVQATRWQAMADYYAQHGSPDVDTDVVAEAPVNR